MTDLELTKACAVAMGITPNEQLVRSVNYNYALAHMGYNPLTNDAQAMELVRKHRLRCHFHYDAGQWVVSDPYYDRLVRDSEAWNESLNRAIVECVARVVCE